MATIEIPFPNTSQTGKILKWRVNGGTMISAGRILLVYKCEGDAAEKKLRATQFGRVSKLHVKEGDTIEPGQVLLSLVGCKHPTVMKDLCAECGADLRQEAEKRDGRTDPVTEASVPMVHSVPELKVCPELAEKIGKEDEQRLLQTKKLALLVDLDQTIVHTTNDHVPVNMKDVFHYQLYGPNSPWYHTRLRPGTRHFLSEMSQLYELHICTFGARNYAHRVAALLDKEGFLFSHRILSRDECFDSASKTANLNKIELVQSRMIRGGKLSMYNGSNIRMYKRLFRALFPCGDDMVCIIDDREDVWQGCGNLVQVKPYHFFRHTGDIHAPPGLEKRDAPEIQDTLILPIKEDEQSETEAVSEDITVAVENGTADDEIEDAVVEPEVTIKEDEPVESTESTEVKKEEDEAKEIDESAANLESTEKPNDEKEQVSEVPETTEKSCLPSNDSGKQEELISDEDQDDYLLYLEDILRRIHAEFYECIDDAKGRKSLREIIPRVRARVLKGLCLTFSGLVPTHQKLHQSRAYKVAKAFGAEVTQDLTDKTTHLVAIKPGTAKANTAKKNKNIKIVNPDWLWLSAERWERVDERLFPLTTKARASRIPPPHCSSPERVEEAQDAAIDSFADSINPLMSFSAEEIENMDKEVDEDMMDQEIDYAGLENAGLGIKRIFEENSDSDVSDGDTDPKAKRKKITTESTTDDSSDERDKYIFKRYNKDDEQADDDDDDPVTRFRRGEDLPDDLDLGDNSQDSIGDPPDDDPDDREWNALGAALEREFLTE